MGSAFLSGPKFIEIWGLRVWVEHRHDITKGANSALSVASRLTHPCRWKLIDNCEIIRGKATRIVGSRRDNRCAVLIAGDELTALKLDDRRRLLTISFLNTPVRCRCNGISHPHPRSGLAPGACVIHFEPIVVDRSILQTAIRGGNMPEVSEPRHGAKIQCPQPFY